MVNIHPTRQEEIPTDHDGIVNRNNDITFSDRSHREEEALLLISDYIDLIRKLIKMQKTTELKKARLTGYQIVGQNITANRCDPGNTRKFLKEIMI